MSALPDIDALIEQNEWESLSQVFAEHPEQVNLSCSGRSGCTRLFCLASLGSTPAWLIDQIVKINKDNPKVLLASDSRYGDTPLHMLCRNSVTSAAKVQSVLSVLAENCPNRDDILVRNMFGGTPLHSACNHNSVVQVLQALVSFNPKIVKVPTHDRIYPIAVLWTSYLQTIPGYMVVASILEFNSGDTRIDRMRTDHFNKFWRKVEYLATAYVAQSDLCPLGLCTFIQDTNIDGSTSVAADNEQQQQVDNLDCVMITDDSDYTIHGLIQCSIQTNMYSVALRTNTRSLQTPDGNGNLPLHLLASNRPFRLKERDILIETIETYPKAAVTKNNDGDYPLWIGIRNLLPWNSGLDIILNAAPHVVAIREKENNFYAFQLAALHSGKYTLDTVFLLLLTQPDLLRSS